MIDPCLVQTARAVSGCEGKPFVNHSHEQLPLVAIYRFTSANFFEIVRTIYFCFVLVVLLGGSEGAGRVGGRTQTSPRLSKISLMQRVQIVWSTVFSRFIFCSVEARGPDGLRSGQRNGTLASIEQEKMNAMRPLQA